MADDFETFGTRSSKKNKKCNSDYSDKSDLISMFTDLIDKIHFKIAIFLFIVSIFIFSDSFVELFLTDIEDATDETDYPTSKGTFIQLILVTLSYIVIDLLASGEII